MNLSNDKKISVFFLVFVAFFIGCFMYASKNGLRGPIDKEDDDSNTEITTKAIQTHEYYSDLEQTKYVIDSKDELEVFESKFEGKLKLDKTNFSKNKVFIQIEEASSSGIKKEIADAIVDDNIVFVIKSESEGSMTDDMALWYYVAIIPNSKLDGVNYDDYYKPSEVINIDNKEYDYVIETDNKYLTMMDDGGSNINIYYQIDIKNHIIIKNKDEYEANLGGTPETIKNIVYEGEITDNDLELIEDIYNRDDLNKDAELPYKINDKEIYDQEVINSLKELFNSIDSEYE